MKLLGASVVTLALLAWATAQTNQPGVSSPPKASAPDSQAITITRSGSQPSRQAPAENFTGSVRVDPLFPANHPSNTSAARVTFEPGARTAWHSHPLGQILIVTSGSGLVQQWGGPIDEIRTGDVVWIPPGKKHWHGASPKSAMSHIALVEQLDGKSTEWMETVNETEYRTPVRPADE